MKCDRRAREEVSLRKWERFAPAGQGTESHRLAIAINVVNPGTIPLLEPVGTVCPARGSEVQQHCPGYPNCEENFPACVFMGTILCPTESKCAKHTAPQYAQIAAAIHPR